MKKAKDSDEMRPEYKLSDFKSKGVRGKYYKRIMAEGSSNGARDRTPANHEDSAGLCVMTSSRPGKLSQLAPQQEAGQAARKSCGDRPHYHRITFGDENQRGRE